MDNNQYSNVPPANAAYAPQQPYSQPVMPPAGQPVVPPNGQPVVPPNGQPVMPPQPNNLQPQPSDKKGNGIAVAALIMSIISLVISIIILVIVLTSSSRSGLLGSVASGYNDRSRSASASISLHNWEISSVDAEIQRQL